MTQLIYRLTKLLSISRIYLTVFYFQKTMLRLIFLNNNYQLLTQQLLLI